MLDESYELKYILSGWKLMKGSEQSRSTRNMLVGWLTSILILYTMPAYTVLGKVGRMSLREAWYTMQGLLNPSAEEGAADECVRVRSALKACKE